jgi:hypothetical protein
MVRMKRRFAVCGTTIGLLLLTAACGGGTDSNDEPEPTAVLTGMRLEFYDLLYSGLDATYRAVYETTEPEGTPGDGYVVFSRPPRSRVDAVPQGSQAADSIIIGGEADDRTIGCSDGPGAWECSEIDSLGDSVLRAAGPVSFLTANDIAGYAVTKAAESRAIAGQQTTCYELEPEDGDGASGGSEYCLTPEGVVLFEATPSQTVEATGFSPQVDEGAFTPPAEPN